MKILPVEAIRQADAYTIKNEPIASIDLMERAARACYEWLKKRLDNQRRVVYFCGMGNNGGDGLAIARMIARFNYNGEVFIVHHSDRKSDDFLENEARLREIRTVQVTDLKEAGSIPSIGPGDVVIDAIFGSGLSQPVTGLAADVIRCINSSGAMVISIDIPSGLFADRHTDEKEGAVIHAGYTLSFEFPKLSFLFPENDKRVGEWEILSIGLDRGFISGISVKNHLTTLADVRPLLRQRMKFAHKGHHGHALIISGSHGMMGAAVLASRACLRSGVGLLHAHVPAAGVSVMQTAVPEAMLSIDVNNTFFSAHPRLEPYTAVGIGPAIGTSTETQNALKLLIQDISVPLVLDADALTILGENKTWLSFLPKNSVLTPHPKEFERLTRKARHDFERNELQREFCMKHGVYVVLKGAHTSVCGPDGVCYFNSTGNPGMATGGSGDVLTGLITGMLAQNYPALHACVLGVYLHGLAGDLAARKTGYNALIAGDIACYIGKAFTRLEKIG